MDTPLENTKICRECGEKPTIHPNSDLCPSCLGKLAWKDGDSKKKASKHAQKRKPTKDKGEPENSQQGRNTALIIDFCKYPSILKELQKLAEEEVRSVDSQIIYILKKHFSET